jgi:hypothetical protein
MSRNRDDAQDRARADLAKVFEVTVNAESADRQTFERSVGPDGAVEQRGASRVTRDIVTRTDQIVRGVEIGDLWQSPESGDYHALAVLRRGPAAQTLRDEIRNLDETTRVNIARAAKEPDGLRQIAAAQRAVKAQTERADAVRTLQVIEPSVGSSPAPWSLGRLVADRDSLIARVTIFPEAVGELAPELKPMIASAVAEVGFRVAEQSAAQYILTAELSLADLGMRAQWYLLKGTLQVVLKNSDGRVRGSERWDIKGSSSLDPVVARNRALDDAARRLKSELGVVILRLADAAD